jgi:hypothetical protein
MLSSGLRGVHAIAGFGDDCQAAEGDEHEIGLPRVLGGGDFPTARHAAQCRQVLGGVVRDVAADRHGVLAVLGEGLDRGRIEAPLIGAALELERGGPQVQ